MINDVEEKYFLTRGKAILFGLILIIVLVIILIIKFGAKKQLEEYKSFENEIKAAAENYIAIKNVDIDDGEEIRISKGKLMSSNLIYNELRDKCSFYAVVLSEKNIVTNKYEISFSSYIKCGRKYMTSNYSEY